MHYEPICQTAVIGGLGRITPTCPPANQHITHEGPGIHGNTLGFGPAHTRDTHTEKSGLVELKSKAAIGMV